MRRFQKTVPGLLAAVLGLAVATSGCTPDAAHRAPRPIPDDGGGSAPPAPSPDPATPPPVSCADAEAWMANQPYKGGKRVTHGDPPHVFECKPWPYSGWCPMAAYEPGKQGAPWLDAWIDLGACP